MCSRALVQCLTFEFEHSMPAPRATLKREIHIFIVGGYI